MSAQHTKGPWKAETMREYQVTADGISANPFECIDINAMTGEAIGMAACDQVAVGQAEANARLIAAAPELLEALQEAEAGLVFAGADIKVKKGAWVPSPTKALQIVRAAIAKATGKKE